MVPHLYYTHYLAGIRIEDVGHLSVLHPKKDGWDLHHLLALPHGRSRKKIQYIRPVVDYPRFARITSLLNKAFQLSDALDPKNFCPIHIQEKWREKPAALLEFEREVSQAFKNNKIKSRRDVLQILDTHNLSPVAQKGSIEISSMGQRWNLVGYAATAHADSPQKLSAYYQRTILPFIQVRDHQPEMEEIVAAYYEKRAQENAIYHGINPDRAPQELIIPSAEFLLNQRKHLQHQYEHNTHRNQSSQTPEYHRTNDDSHHQEVRKATHSTREIASRSDKTTQNGDREHQASVSPIERARTRVQQDQHKLKAVIRETESWIHMILGLLRTPQWWRRIRAQRTMERSRMLKRYPDLRPRFRSPLPKVILTAASHAIFRTYQLEKTMNPSNQPISNEHTN